MQLLFPVGYGVMDLNSNGEQIGDRCFLYPLPTEIEVEISHNSALIHVVLYLCISFVRHGKWSVKISTYRRTVPHRYLVHHLVFLIEMCKIIFFTNVKNQTTGFKLQFLASSLGTRRKLIVWGARLFCRPTARPSVRPSVKQFVQKSSPCINYSKYWINFFRISLSC